LRFIDPGDPKSFKRFYRLGRVVLKPAENDQPVAGRLDLVIEQPETAADAERGDLALDQPLRGLRQRPLRLADTDRKRAALGLAGLDEEFAEEVRFTRAAASVNPLVARGRKQRLEHLRCRNLQNGQWRVLLTMGIECSPAALALYSLPTASERAKQLGLRLSVVF
jgi:hypothetical protein